MSLMSQNVNEMMSQLKRRAQESDLLVSYSVNFTSGYVTLRKLFNLSHIISCLTGK